MAVRLREQIQQADLPAARKNSATAIKILRPARGAGFRKSDALECDGALLKPVHTVRYCKTSEKNNIRTRTGATAMNIAINYKHSNLKDFINC